jgi:AAA15 family ATPase/GTPase
MNHVQTGWAILQEQLIKITAHTEEILYSRPGKPKDPSLQAVFDGTRDNQLFLTNSVSQKVQVFRPLYDWFKKRLILIAPDWRFGPFEQFLDDKKPLYATMNTLLPQLDTGIVHLGAEEIPFENIALSEQEKVAIQEYLKEGRSVKILSQQVVMKRKDGRLSAKKLVSFHRKSDGTKVQFDIRQESDGTQRVIDLLPAFFDLCRDENLVYVIDEIDRSMHTLLIKTLLESYLSCCSTKSRSQLLFTTHDLLLMDNKLLRHDEMWGTERDTSGASTLFSFSDYKDAARDKDIRKSYLQGRLGGIPRILLSSPCEHSEGAE